MKGYHRTVIAAPRGKQHLFCANQYMRLCINYRAYRQQDRGHSYHLYQKNTVGCPPKF
jgi:hypothetical protein